MTDYGEMAKKTAFRRVCKWLDLSPEFEVAVEKDDADYINADFTDVPTQSAVKQVVSKPAPKQIAAKPEPKPESKPAESEVAEAEPIPESVF